MFTMIAVLPDHRSVYRRRQTGSKGNRLRTGKSWSHAIPHPSPTRQKHYPLSLRPAAAVE